MCVSGEATAGYPGCCNLSCYIRAGGTQSKEPDAPDLQDRPSLESARCPEPCTLKQVFISEFCWFVFEEALVPLVNIFNSSALLIVAIVGLLPFIDHNCAFIQIF